MKLNTFFLVKIAQMIIANMSEDLKAFVKSAVKDLETKAKGTKSPWDDMFVTLLKVILGLDS